jgi:hypothetical protein
MALLLLILTFAALVAADRLLGGHRRVKDPTGLDRCTSRSVCTAFLLLLPGVAAAALAGLATPPPAPYPSSTFWLDLTNAALGVVTLGALATVAVAVVRELASRDSVDKRR